MNLTVDLDGEPEDYGADTYCVDEPVVNDVDE